jgi:hypothetical protein
MFRLDRLSLTGQEQALRRNISAARRDKGDVPPDVEKFSADVAG